MIPNPEVQEILSEILKVKRELYTTLRDKSINNQFLNEDLESVTKESSLQKSMNLESKYKDLNIQLGNTNPYHRTTNGKTLQ